MKKIFIDGSAGTTGLRIRDRLAGRADVSLVTLPEELREDPAARAEALNAADVAFLCLPDAAAVVTIMLLISWLSMSMIFVPAGALAASSMLMGVIDHVSVLSV